MRVSAPFLFLVSAPAAAALVLPTTVKVDASRVVPAGRRGFLLGGAAFVAGSWVPGAATAARPEYLTEPTEEFKASEAQRAEFRRQNIAIKAKFTVVLDKFETSKTEAAITSDLTDIKRLVAQTGGLPTGLKRDDIVKLVRRKKASMTWPTTCEIAYQTLTREIDYQQSPNKDKDMPNPIQ